MARALRSCWWTTVPRDRTFHLLREIAAVDSRVTVVRLRRNFGQTSALAAGFDHARGEYIIAMDGDLQHDPADIPIFLEKIAEGYDIVSGWRKQRIDNLWLRRIPSRCANWLMAKLSGVRYPRLRHHVQSLPPRHSGAGSALRRTAPLYSGAGFVAWSFDLRSADPQCEPRARGVALRNFAHLPRLFRSDHDSLPAALSFPSAALLRHRRDAEHHGRHRRYAVAARGEIPAASPTSWPNTVR